MSKAHNNIIIIIIIMALKSYYNNIIIIIVPQSSTNDLHSKNMTNSTYTPSKHVYIQQKENPIIIIIYCVLCMT